MVNIQLISPGSLYIKYISWCPALQITLWVHSTGENYTWLPSSWVFSEQKRLVQNELHKKEAEWPKGTLLNRQEGTLLHICPELLQYPQMEKGVTWQWEEAIQMRLKIPTWEAGYIIQEPGWSEICAGSGQPASHTWASQVKLHLGKPVWLFRDDT